MMAAILAAQWLANWDGRRSPAFESGIADAIASRGADHGTDRWQVSFDAQSTIGINMHRRSGMSRPPLLFNSVGIFEVIEQHKAEVKELVRQVPASQLEDESLPENIVRPLLVEIPVLDEAAKYAESREIDVDVSGDPMRMIFDRSRPFYIKGTEITVVIPFKGDPRAFEIQPTSYNLNPPFGLVEDHELRLVFRVTNPDVNINAELDRSIAQVRQYVDWLRPSAEQMKRELTLLAQSGTCQRF